MEAIMRQELEVMRVFRVPPLGKLEIELNGKRYQRLEDIADEAAKRRLLTAVGELVSLVGSYDRLVEFGVAPPLTPPAAAAPPPPPTPTAAPTPTDAEPMTAEQARFLQRLEQERDAVKRSLRGAPIETIPVSALAEAETAEQAVPPEKPPSEPPPGAPPDVPPDAPPPRQPRSATRQAADVATQIDAIVQSLKAQDPALAQHTIRLRQNPEGGLHIEVDGQLYSEPGQIENGQVQKLIRQAVQTWRSG
jgi:hypothetical protein